MPLTTRQELLLHEIYGLPYGSNTIVLGESGLAMLPPLTELFLSARTQLDNAILRINQEESMVQRVSEILAEFEGFALDPSPINRDGYGFNATRNLQNLQKLLYPYTGIVMGQARGGNQIPLG